MHDLAGKSWKNGLPPKSKVIFFWRNFTSNISSEQSAWPFLTKQAKTTPSGPPAPSRVALS